MNNLKRLILSSLFVLPLFASAINAKNSSCCATGPIEFAKLADDKNFRDKHDAPVNLSEYKALGEMKEIAVKSGAKAKIYTLTAKQKSNNYIIVFHEWWGLNNYVKRESDFLYQELGNVNVIAVDLYDGKVATNADDAGKLMQAVDNERALNIVKSVIESCGKDAKIATIGWCFGGGWSMQAALNTGKNLKACVMFYGMPEKEVSKLKTLNSDVLFIYGKQDKWINQQVADEFAKNMKSANKKLSVSAYDADHAFANPSNPKYNSEYAKAAHKEAVEFIKKRF